jgi:hypothetical protein
MESGTTFDNARTEVEQALAYCAAKINKGDQPAVNVQAYASAARDLATALSQLDS